MYRKRKFYIKRYLLGNSTKEFRELVRKKNCDAICNKKYESLYEPCTKEAAAEG